MIPLRRGINISHWLSQSSRRGAERRAAFTEVDVQRIAAFGFDHLRLPVDEEQLWDEAGRPHAEAFELMEAALGWARRANLAVIFDFHILRSHCFGQTTEPALFTHSEEAEKFADYWRQLTVQFAAHPPEFLIFELMNEPVASNPEDWNRVGLQAYRAIREQDPDRWIVLGSNFWNSVFTFDQLRPPLDPRLILTFHYYLPMFVTHHRAGWCAEGRMYDGPIQYPGHPIAPESLHRVTLPKGERLINLRIETLNQFFDRNRMLADLAQPLAVAKRTGLPLYCGEFGVINRVPLPIRVAWTRDLVSVFAECGIAWAHWDYRGDFGILGENGVIPELMAALGGIDSRKRMECQH